MTCLYCNSKDTTSVIYLYRYNDNNTFIKKNNDFEFKELNEIQRSILKLIMDKPNITQDELGKLLGVTLKTISRNFKILLENNYIKRVGANKNGYWKIINKDI